MNELFDDRALDAHLDNYRLSPLRDELLEDLVAHVVQADPMPAMFASLGWRGAGLLASLAMMGFVAGIWSWQVGAADKTPQAYVKLMLMGPSQMNEVWL